MKWHVCVPLHDGAPIPQVPCDARTRDARSRVFSKLLPRLANKQKKVTVRKFYHENLSGK